MSEPENDYTSFYVTFVDNGDKTSNVWVFDKDTVMPDITAYELAQILRIAIKLDDRYMDKIIGNERLMRHFKMRSESWVP